MQYIEIVENAITYMEENIEVDITVFDVAKAVGYSYYHLSRIFLAHTHESMGSYLKYRRLGFAARQLLTTNQNILDIGIGLGFQSHEAFTRAFKQRYSLTPYNYRKRGVLYYTQQKDKTGKEMLQHLEMYLICEVKVIIDTDIIVIGQSHKTSLYNNNLSQAWKTFIQAKNQIPDISSNQHFSICESNTTVYNEHNDVSFPQFIATKVDTDNFEIPTLMEQRIIKAGEYMVFTQRGKVKRLALTYQYIWGIWLPNTKLQVDMTRNDFEMYDARFLGQEDENSIIDIYIPILSSDD